MNCTECCHAIGCNCAGTCSIETLSKIPYWTIIPVIAIVLTIIFIVVHYFLQRGFGGVSE